ncbi:MAG: GatB/YqeY domain-containing protein [Synergistaceae bacterium]|nr:GatB/YqeY domain-containing protein [Synergistaceae bacterium]MBQ6909029.1 GatB/YqeY domain-containing protein [Synergistaceae bacterium]MBQ9580842.1 GatB/YqeY domain-containing protein [Synergistaceae bacterium]MBQ9897016.1 GatB/YqeY domain-containing protein [Synergistaceae bacterium]MBR0043670.1 GatB/YqeY domain-containing protein [Synergistaceae bacterium]
MSLVEQVAADLMAAMKARDDAKLSALRMLKAEFQKLQADKGVGVKIADEDAQAVIRRLIKQRKEAAEQFKAGGALDRAEAELSDIKFLEPYLPAQLDDAELDKLIEAAAAEVGASSVKDMGKLMKAVMSKTAGRADGGRVKNRVTAFLNK